MEKVRSAPRLSPRSPASMRRRLCRVRPSVEEAKGPDSVRRASGWRKGLVVEARRYEEMRFRAAEEGMRRVVCFRRGGLAVDIEDLR